MLASITMPAEMLRVAFRSSLALHIDGLPDRRTRRTALDEVCLRLRQQLRAAVDGSGDVPDAARHYEMLAAQLEAAAAELRATLEDA